MKRTGYKQSQREYAETYKAGVRTIKRYMAKGYPLDDPAKMEAVFAGQKHRPQGAGATVTVDAASLTDEQFENPPDEATAKLYERILICRKLAHDLRERRRLFISTGDVREGVMRVEAAVKDRLLTLPEELPPLLVGQEPAGMQQALFAWVHRTLTALSDPRSALYAS